MPLNPQVEALLAQLAQMPATDYATITAPEMRAAGDNPIAVGPPLPVAEVRNIAIPLEGRTLAARLYIPEGAGDSPPLTVFYHGGGWVIGTLETHDATCRALARASGSALLSVAYRLAPEHPYPAPVEDAYAALCWAAANAASLGVDGARLAVAGDSAGGNLAAATAIMARDRNGPALRYQLLLYPVTDADFTRPSYRENGGQGGFLTEEAMRWFWRQYLGDTPASQAPLALVLNTADLSCLPAATVITAEYDPLRDEGMAYAKRLREFGVDADADVAEGMIHGFFSLFELVPDAVGWLHRAGSALNRAFS